MGEKKREVGQAGSLRWGALVGGPNRARVFVRFGFINTNPDGQAAVFSRACVTDPGVCDPSQLREAAKRVTLARFVASGNQLRLFLLGGHPSVSGSK